MRRLKKLVTKPGLFFRDYFLKRHPLPPQSTPVSAIKPTAARVTQSIETYALKNNLLIDRIADSSGIFEALVLHLRELGCYIQTICSESLHSKTIAFKFRDRDYLYNAMNTFEHDGIKVLFLTNPKHLDHRRRIPFYLVGFGRCYSSHEFYLDPWVEDATRVYSHSPNPFISSVPALHINRTVSALHPYSLQGDPSSDISLKGMLGVDESLEQNFEFPIDLVYTWVDGTEENWLARKLARSDLHVSQSHDDASQARYRSIDELRYSLRSVAAFGKFARNIYIVTDNQTPRWLNVHHPRIKVIDHREIFTEADCLPTFNSHAIEANLYKIPELAEHFLYMNDDFFLWNHASPSDYFHANGLSKSFLETLPNVYGAVTASTPAWKAGALNSNELLYRQFSKKLHTHHLHVPYALRRSVFEKMWSEFPDEYNKISRSAFRSNTDISPTSFLYHAYSFLTQQSTFASYRDKRFTLASAKFPQEIASALHDPSIKAVCINDGHSEHYEANVLAFTKAMLSKFPVAAHWELDR